jgi:membrane protease YdiL (CAAX protease family)
VADVQPYAPAGSLSRRQESIELAVFLLLIVPSLVLSFAPNSQGNVSFALVAVATTLRDLGLLALILLLLARGNQPLTAIGWVSQRAGREVALGLVLSIPVIIGTQILQALLRAAGLSGPSETSGVMPAKTVGDIILAVVLVVVVAVAEETIFRGYLILRFARALNSRTWAVVLSSVAFAIGHGYEGGAAVVTVGLTGLAFALVYIWRRSLVAPVVMHFVLDFIAIVLAPVFSR